MRKKAAILLAGIMVMLSFGNFSALAVDSADTTSSAIGTVAYIRNSINSYKSKIQKQNELLLRLSAEELAEAEFEKYDTSATLLGEELFDFADAKGKSGDIESIINGKENTVVTLKDAEFRVPSFQQYGKHPGIFQSDMIIKAENGKRAKFVCDYAEDVPSYQIVKNKRNIYCENIDFSDFPMMKFENCSNIIFNNCSFTDFEMNGLVMRNCKDISILNCTFTDCGHAISDETNSGYSIRIVGDEDSHTGNILIENCTINHSYGKAISFVGSVDDYVIRNNTIKNTAWGGIDFWYPSVSGQYVNVIENNTLTDIGFGEGARDNRAYGMSGVGCAAIYAGRGCALAKSVVKNNVINRVVETGIEGPYELVYHNTVKNTGENSVKRYTASTEAVYIKLSTSFEQKYIDNNIETRGLRCISSYSEGNEEYEGVYIMNNRLNLKSDDETITRKYSRCDIDLNCKRIKKIVISGNTGMMTKDTSVNIFLEKGYTMDYFDINNPCKIGAMPESARYCFNINNNGF